MCTCLYFVQVTGFLEKNRDGLKPDLEDLISRCGNKVHYVFLNCCYTVVAVSRSYAVYMITVLFSERREIGVRISYYPKQVLLHIKLADFSG